MQAEKIILDEIQRQYGSKKAFSTHAGIPRTTLSDLLERGIERSTVQTFRKVCDALGLPASELLSQSTEPTLRLMVCTEQEQNILELCRANKELNSSVLRFLGIGESAPSEK